MNNNAIRIDGVQGVMVPVSEGVATVRFNHDSTLNVNFYNRPVIDPTESRQRGRPWMKGVDYIRVQNSGERDTVDRPATDADRQRFPRHWEAYRNGRQQIPAGTAVDVLFPQTPEIATNLHGLGVHTVEQLAGLTEHGSQTIGMGATMWRNKAKEFLSAANGGAGVHRLQAQLDGEKNKNEVLSNQVALLKRQLDALAARVEQNIPGAMIPAAHPTVAQNRPAHAPMSFSNDVDEAPKEVVDWDQAKPSDDGAGPEPLFQEWSDSASAENEASAAAPEPRPRGRPRKIV